MKTTVGIFPGRRRAEDAVAALVSAGVPKGELSLLTPHSSENELEVVPTSDTEGSGTGAAIGAVTGGAVGASAGLGLAPAVASLLIPGVGPIAAIGFAGAAFGALSGAVGGGVAGGAVDRKLADGLPHDELFLYEDALRKGKSVVIAMSGDHGRSDRIRTILVSHGAESIDAARESWWVGLREPEELEYRRDGGDFTKDEERFRKGFEAAQRPVEPDLDRDFPDLARDAAFRRGYERGRAYRARIREEEPVSR
jgi:hypothetical protein